MATRKPESKPARRRNHDREEKGRVTSIQTTLRLTEEERARVDKLSERLKAPIKSAVLAAVDAALAAMAKGATLDDVRAPLKADLSPAKPGPKVAPADKDEA